MLSEWDSKHYIMTAANLRRDYGLTAGHAYTIIGTAMYQGKGLVKIRNPYGEEAYTGPWSDKSTMWTADALKKLGHRKSNDGTFWMPVELYWKIFYGTYVG
jgi:tmRNA-binding protein